ncbi:MAG: MamK family actin-like protein [bacterium]|nr:MamK family actin-like protein [bacterium]
MAEVDTPTESPAASQSNNVLYLGVDLGTSNSSVATSTDITRTVPSVVGWPKDLVAYKFLQKPIVFGEECVRNRMSLDLFYPLENGVFKFRPEGESEEREVVAVQELVRHVIELAEIQSGTVRAVVGAPALASVNDKQAIIDVMQDLIDSVMVVSEPFLVAYGLGLYNNALIVDIGAGTLDLCRMHGTIPDDEDQRTLYKAGNYVDEQFHDLLQDKIQDSPISRHLANSIKERYSFVSPITEGISVEFQVAGKPVLYNIAEELKTACESLLPDMFSAIRELITTFEPEFQDELRNNIVLAGGGSQIKGLPEIIESHLSEFGAVRVTIVDDPVYAGALGALKLAQDMPESEWASV